MLKNYLFSLLIIVLMASVYQAYRKGYESGQADLIAVHNQEIIKLQTKFARELQEKQNEILEVENEWLEADTSTRVIYRERTRKVVETVTKYVNRNNLDKCRLDDDSMQQINQALRGATESSDTQ